MGGMSPGRKGSLRYRPRRRAPTRGGRQRRRGSTRRSACTLCATLAPPTHSRPEASRRTSGRCPATRALRSPWTHTKQPPGFPKRFSALQRS